MCTFSLCVGLLCKEQDGRCCHCSIYVGARCYLLSNSKDADDFKEKNYTIFPDEYVPIFKTQTSFPAINIAHLAVAKNYQDKGVGTNILSYIIDTFIDYDLAGCQIVTVDSLNTPRVNSFYMRNGFRNFTDSDATAKTRRMYLLLEEFRNTES